MAWEPSWETLGEVEELIEADQKAGLDKEGYRPKTIIERVYKALAMTVFIVVFPFVFFFLGAYRAFSLLGTTKRSSTD
jgi:hypothetical protein